MILLFGEFIFLIRDINCYGKDNDECFIFNNCGEIIKRIKFIFKFFGIIENENDIIVVCFGLKCLYFFENKSFNFKKSEKFINELYCIVYFFFYMFVVYGDNISRIIKFGLCVFCRIINI